MSQSTTSSAASSADATPMAAAKAPIGPGGISLVGLVLALLVVGLGVIGVQAALVISGALSGSSWFDSVVSQIDGASAQGWMVPAGVVLALVGLWLLVLAIKPRPRTAVAVQAETGVFLRPRDLARIAVSAADGVGGVEDAHASASRGRVTVSVTTTGEDHGVADAVEAAVSQRFAALQKPARVDVRMKAGAS